MALFDKKNKEDFFKKAKSVAEKAGNKSQNVFDKAKTATKNYTDGLKQAENLNKELAAASMEERVKMRPEGVRYCIVNHSRQNLGCL